MKRILTYILLFLVFSCGQTNEEEIADAIAEANLLLSDRRCSEALQVMLAVEVQPRNKDYVDTLATAFACIGNYSTTTLFATDFTNLNTTAGGFFGSLAAFSTSDDMTTPDDTDFVSLQLAIDVLLYAGGFTSAAATNRATVFNSSDATDINLQAFYMIIVNMGRWFRYYGNTNSAGLKGAGGEPNTCLATYTDNAVGGAIPAISLGGTGSCTNAANTGHVDIETGDSDERKVRLCQGIILFNNFIDTISISDICF